MGDRGRKYNASSAGCVGNPDPVDTVLGVMILATVLEVVATAASGVAAASAHGWK